jgi:type III restriction enzyme
VTSGSIDRLIVNSPYGEPGRYWRYDRETQRFDLIEGERRPAGYVRASENSKSFDDPGEFIELPLVNRIRQRVKQWREAGYPGVTGTTKRLLEHWYDPDQREGRRFFFCQLEAMETLIWWVEASPSERQGIEISGDGGEFTRLCSKMATGSGKTIVMAMLIAWQVLNKVASPLDTRFSKNVLVVAPGLTVKSRLQVLFPHGPGNYYDEFDVVPPGLRDRLRQAKVMVRNWHALLPLDPNEGPKVVKKGPESDEVFTKRVLEEMANAKNIVVINDEAHHAWRVAPKSTVKGVSKADIEEATLWVGGLDRIHRTRKILTCFDLSATPFAPTGKQSGEATLFDWIVSDFNLNDAIESGLVKTPRVVVRDDGKHSSDYKSRLYHIYRDPEVQPDLNRKAKEEEPLPDLVITGYYLLGRDWLETAERWEVANASTPPVMITVGNRTETAARVHHAFAKGNIQVADLGDPARMLRIDSKVLEKAEEREEAATVEAPTITEDAEAVENGAASKKLSAQEQAELLRRTVDTVGRPGEPGEKVQNVISVGMLSEGWDAKTVTHIMGLRAFSSQLLCEQVVGRGLRRTSYEVDPETRLFEPEYVNIFGVPFTFLPHEGGDGPPPPPPSPKTRIEALPERSEYEIKWPNILRVDHEYRPRLELDLEKVEPLNLNAKDNPMLAQLAPIVAGKPNIEQIQEIDLLDLARENRMQRIAFQTARDVFDQMTPSWTGNREFLLAQLIRLVENFMKSDRIRIIPEVFGKDDLRRRLILSLNMNKIMQHIWEAVRFENSTALVPVFDTERPIRSTADMPTWFTSRPSHYVKKSQINQSVFDGTWEASEAFDLDHSDHVAAWAKNDHLGFEILYVYKGVIKKYRPDFLIRLKTGETLVLEVKGQDTQQNQTKRKALDEWTKAVTAHGGFGRWRWAVSFDPGDLPDILGAT